MLTRVGNRQEDRRMGELPPWSQQSQSQSWSRSRSRLPKKATVWGRQGFLWRQKSGQKERIQVAPWYPVSKASTTEAGLSEKTPPTRLPFREGRARNSSEAGCWEEERGKPLAFCLPETLPPWSPLVVRPWPSWAGQGPPGGSLQGCASYIWGSMGLGREAAVCSASAQRPHFRMTW